MRSILAAICCCFGKEPSLMYTATKCPNYSRNPCIYECGNCCDGVDPPEEIYLCDWYLAKIGVLFPLDPDLCYVIEYRGCAYVLKFKTEPCPSVPPAGVFNEGTLLEIKAAKECCPEDPPTGPCVPDLIVEGFPYADPWGIQADVTISGTIDMCVKRNGTWDISPNVCHRPGEFLDTLYATVSVDTTQLVGKCWEGENPDVATGNCTPSGAEYLNKVSELRLESFNPCNCLGSPGDAIYLTTYLKCYEDGDCAQWYCNGYCPVGDPSQDAAYAACVANRFDCTTETDPLTSFELFTRYTLIKSNETYPCGGDGEPACECDYYEADALRITFPLCYAVNSGFDPTDPADTAAIHSLYMSKVEAFDYCEPSPCVVNVGAQFGGIMPVTCIRICGEFGYVVNVFSGGAGDIANKINSKLQPNITAASLNQWFWFGYRQGLNLCAPPSPPPDPNARPPYGPGDLIEVDRAVIDTANWKCYVFLKGRSPRFRYCVFQQVSAPVGSVNIGGTATCMSTNAVSPAEWASGIRPAMSMVRNDCPAGCPPGVRCQKPVPVNQTDCTTIGSYPQGNTISGSVYTPGYVQTFGSPCGTGWLDTGCKHWACTRDGCSCDDCDAGTCPPPCCNCSGGAPPTPCKDHVLQCDVASNHQVSIT
jgi:hypothetical protein